MRKRVVFLRLAQVLHKDEARDDVTISRWRVAFDCACFFFESPRHASQGFICEFVGPYAILAVEVSHQPPPHLQILLSVGTRAFVQPVEEAMECFGGQLPEPLSLHPSRRNFTHHVPDSESAINEYDERK